MSSTTTTAERTRGFDLLAYIQIARIDHWFKNAFMLLGVILAVFYEPSVATWASLVPLGIAVLATCLVASSNYVLNELLDGPNDMLHPEKRFRPVPSGRVRPSLAYAEWLLFAAAGFALAASLNKYFLASAVWLWVMGILYNVPPIRTKEWPYVDVLSESINNPIRLLLGWFALVTVSLPPVSLAVSYWMVGAFFMAMKRYAEYRHIGNPEVAAAYRKSFSVLHGGPAPHQPLLLRDDLRAVRRRLHRPLPRGAHPLRAARGRALRVLHEDRPAAGQPGAEPGEAVPRSAGSSPT